MPHPLLRHAERIKLARTLNAAPERVEFLASLGSADVRQLRVAASRYLFNQHHGLFQRVAGSSKLVPAAITAKLSRHVFGPLISARVAGLMPPQRAVDVSTHLPVDFLADLTLDMDPASAPELLGGMPVDVIVDVARELQRRKEFITMARFVDNLAPPAIRAVVNDVLDDEALVRIGFYVESGTQLTQVMNLLPAERLRRTVRLTTTGSRELQEAGIVLLCKAGDKIKGKLGDAAAGESEEMLVRMIRSVLAAGERDAVEAMIANMSEPHRARARALL